MPTGKVKFFDADKGFGFVASDDGGEVFVHANALPAGTESLKPGTRVEFGVADGRKGPSALTVRVLDAPQSVRANQRKPADDMAAIVEDLINLLDGVSAQLNRGRYPEKAMSGKVAQVLRAVADDLDV